MSMLEALACPHASGRNNTVVMNRMLSKTPVEGITQAIADELGLTNKELLKKTNEELRSQGFENFTHLCRLSNASLLDKLDLPLLYKSELISLIKSTNATQNPDSGEEAKTAEKWLHKHRSVHDSLRSQLSGSGAEEAGSGSAGDGNSLDPDDDVAPAYPFTPEQRTLINETWGNISTKETGSMGMLAKQVYERLFRSAPGIKRLFKDSDMLAISRAFGGMLGVLVSAVNQPLQFQHIVKGLGVRHQVYGVKPDHFRIMYTSLVRTFAQILGDKFTSEHKKAWSCLYNWVIDAMQRSMRESTVGKFGSIMMAAPGGKFRRYYATLTNFRFFLTKKRSDPTPKFQLELGEIADVFESKEDLGNPKMFKELCFIVETVDGKQVYFACGSEDEMNEWLNEIDWRIVATARAATSVFGAAETEGMQTKNTYKRWKHRNRFLNQTHASAK